MRQNPGKLLGALGLCRKAGALAVGFDAAAEKAAKGHCALLLLASNLSPGTEKRIRHTVSPFSVPIRRLPCTQQELAFITQKPAGILAVCNPDFAALCLANVQPEEESN